MSHANDAVHCAYFIAHIGEKSAFCKVMASAASFDWVSSCVRASTIFSDSLGNPGVLLRLYVGERSFGWRYPRDREILNAE